MKEYNRERGSKIMRSRDPQDKKSIRRSSSPRGSRELRKKLTSLHEDERTKRVVSSKTDHDQRGQDNSRDASTRKRQDDRQIRNKSPHLTKSSHLERKRDEDNGRLKLREATETKKERKEVLGDESARNKWNDRSTFGNPQAQQYDSGIANGGFGSHKNTGMDESKRIGTQVKPRILAPNNGGKDGTGGFQGMAAAPKFTVNELSAESIKREYPMKGANQRRLLSNRGGFGMKRQHAGIRGGATFIGATRIQQQKHGRTFDGFNPTAKMIQPIEQVERSKLETEQALVPRGRNYFIHDHRDAKFGTQRNLMSNVRFGHERKPPVGWRNFGNEEETVDKLNFSTQTYGRGAATQAYGRGAGVGWSARGGFAKFGGLRSKADEDLIWKHDKYVEVSQDEANTKLELVDEVGAESQQEIFKMTQPQEGESRHRYQEECLDYEVEELAVYD